MPDFYATSTNNAVEISKDVVPYKDTNLLKNLVSDNSDFSISAEDLDGITNIVSYAFYQRKKLASIEIPNGVTSIGNYAFCNCTSLTNITCLAITPPTIQSTTFDNVPATCVIKVPAGSVAAYKSATNWSARANYIQAI